MLKLYTYTKLVIIFVFPMTDIIFARKMLVIIAPMGKKAKIIPIDIWVIWNDKANYGKKLIGSKYEEKHKISIPFKFYIYINTY